MKSSSARARALLIYWEWYGGIPYGKMKQQPMMQDSPMIRQKSEFISTPTNVPQPLKKISFLFSLFHEDSVDDVIN
jgi:hypothetical protein